MMKSKKVINYNKWMFIIFFTTLFYNIGILSAQKFKWNFHNTATNLREKVVATIDDESTRNYDGITIVGTVIDSNAV
ncbi:hypothetical protein ACG2LH_11505 [Zhouia sp. PK063]|uniref:hypothetical protein n=1 Tax=Zhouia sp. PK063 TaxID=3373602 RepID=UPI00378A796B